MPDAYSRHLEFDFVHNIRDLGGYRTKNGRSIAWRRLFRSGELLHTTNDEVSLLRDKTGLGAVLDLRSDMEIKQEKVALISGGGIRYHNVPFITGGGSPGSDGDLFERFTNMGEFYLLLLNDKQFGSRVVKALEIIAGAREYPVLFHCTVGKDRTGVLAAMVLGLLGVSDEDIIEDYHLTTSAMPAFLERMKDVPEAQEMLEKLPAYFWEASRESMKFFLSAIYEAHGSIRGYIEAQDVDSALFDRLEAALLDGS